MKIIWTQTALDRLKAVHDYIKIDNPQNAQQWAENVVEKVDSLSELPNRGRKIPEVEFEKVREIIFGNYGIIYKINKESISVMTIRHFKQILPIEEIVG